MPSSNGFSEIHIASLERVAPQAIPNSPVGVRVTHNSVDLQWSGVLDDANGSGMWCYGILRNGVSLVPLSSPSFSYSTVAPGTDYTYDVYTIRTQREGGTLSAWAH